MYVAGELYGWNHKFPVLVINWFDEKRHQRDVIAENKRAIHNKIFTAYRNARFYRYDDLEQFKDQFQSELNKAYYISRNDDDIAFDLTISGDACVITVKEVEFDFELSELNITKEDETLTEDMNTENGFTEPIMIEVMSKAFGICWHSPIMALDAICNTLYINYGIDATWKSNSIYIDDTRILSIEFSHEGKSCWAIYKVRTYNLSSFKKVYNSEDLYTEQ